MRKISLLFLVVNAIKCSVIAQINQPQIYAMVIGVSNYKDANIPSLKFAAKDASAFAGFLKSPEGGAVPVQNLKLLTDTQATRSIVLKELNQLVSRSGPEDLFIFYFSGHGKNDVLENAGYLLTYDTENENESGSALSMDDVNIKIGRGKAKMKLAYIDACHAGLFKSIGTKGGAVDNSEILKAYQTSLANAADGNAAFMASTSRQQSLEDEKLGHGVFTYYLLKGLRGKADEEQKGSAGYNDGIVTIGEIHTFLLNNIQEATNYKQKPGLTGDFDADFPLSVIKPGIKMETEIARRPAKTEVAVPETSFKSKEKKSITEKIPDNVAFAKPLCYGMFTVVNKFSSPVTIVFIRGFKGIKTDIIVAPGKSITTPRVCISNNAGSVEDCANKVYDCSFTFNMTENGLRKQAHITVTANAGIVNLMEISPENLLFSH